MSTTVAEIAASAFTAVAAELPDVIQACTLTRTIQGDYDTVTGEYETTTEQTTGRAVFDTSTKIDDALPGYVAGPTEKLVYFEGLGFAPKENDAVTISGTAYTVVHIGDIVGAGTFFACTVVNS